MNWIFLGIFEDIQSFFDEVIWSKFNTEEISGSNAKELVSSFFEHNPIKQWIAGRLVVIFFRRELQMFKMLLQNFLVEVVR